METSSAAFSVDADNRIANRDGFVAVVMQVKGRLVGNKRRFRFKTSTLGSAAQVEWDDGLDYQTFPREITGTMVRNGYARYAPEEMLDQINAGLTDNTPEKETTEADTPAPKKRPSRSRKEKTDGED